jgi:hypothetical protein
LPGFHVDKEIHCSFCSSASFTKSTFRTCQYALILGAVGVVAIAVIARHGKN